MKLIDADAFKKYIKGEVESVIETAFLQGNLTKAGEKRMDTFLQGILEDVDKQPTVNPWIPCSEKTPENGETVLVIARPDHDSVSVKFTATYDKERDVWFVQTGENTAAYPHEYKPVYWMPIPELKEER